MADGLFYLDTREPLVAYSDDLASGHHCLLGIEGVLSTGAAH